MLRTQSACAFLLVFLVALVCLPCLSFAQDSADAEKERIAADRFLQVLLRRPRPGTALDRVYGYHIQAGTLDKLEADLKAKGDKADDRGASPMLCGLLQLQRGHDAEAAKSLAKAEELRTDDAMASYYLGKALLLVGRTDAAADAFQRAIDRKPEKNEALPVFTELGRLYSRSQQKDKALSVWKRLEEMFPGDARVGEQIARTLAEEGQDEAALERYQVLAKQSTTATDDFRSAGYQIAAGELKRRMGRAAEALQDFETLLARLRPSSWLYADVRRRIESGFLKTGDYAALADYYAKQVEQHKDEIELRLRLGQTLSKAGRLNEAEAALRAATDLAPENTDARLALIDIFKTAGKPADAAAQLEILIKQDAQNPDFYVRLGNSWLDDQSIEKKVRFEKAAAAWQRLAGIRKDDAVVTAQVADLMRRIELTDNAIALYRRAIELAPDQPQYREYLGEFLFRLDRKEEALATWAGIADGKLANRDNFVRLAEVLNTFEYPDKALDAFAAAAKLDLTFGQRLRFAEFLSRATRYDDSLLQLDDAEKIAESLEEREQMLKSRIGVYASSGTLDQRIAEATDKAKSSNQAIDYRQLAVMHEAASRVADATLSIETAIKLEPKDTSSLGVAAELYRKGSRYGDAITAYRALAKLDSRFLPNYLKQIAALQMQLGQVDDAMATAEELIAAQPGNPESYRLFAEQCFRLGRDDEGIEKLRRALQTAPRDREAKRALASALSDRFRTDEAIELNWSLLEDADELSEQTGIVTFLATLYERKGDFNRLVDRLELRGREASNMRGAILLISAAHKATNDLGSARRSLEPLLAENPRDAELLQQMVALSQAADDAEAALGYQQQLTALADTPENRNRLLMLMVDSGRVDAAEASLQRLQGFEDPVTMIGMIDRTMKRGENEAAIRFCQAVLERRSDLWEVRVRLAALLILSDKIEAALAEADRVDALTLDPTTKSEVIKAREQKQGNRPVVASQLRPTGRLNANPYSAQLGSMFKVGRYANTTFGSSATSILSPNDVREAKEQILALRMIVSIKQNRLNEFIATKISLEEINTTTNIEKLWLARNISSLKSQFTETGRQQPNQVSAAQEEANLLLWRLAKLDTAERKAILSFLVRSRLQLRYPRGLDAPSGNSLGPLSNEQLQLAIDTYDSGLGDAKNNNDAYFVSALFVELLAAKRDEDAKRISDKYSTSPQTFTEALSSMMFYSLAKSSDQVTILLAEIGSRFPQWSKTINNKELAEASQTCSLAMSLPKLSSEAKLTLSDLGLAYETILNSKQSSNRRASMRTGMTQINYPVLTGQSIFFRSKEIPAPFSSRLLSDAMIQRLYQSLKIGEASTDRDLWVKHLQEDITMFPAGSELALAERKTRRVLYAFTRWWMDDLAGAAEAIDAACKEAPEDNDLWIEKARFAAELNRPQAALDALDAINPVDQATLQIRELAAMNLASRLGKLERAKTAAQRLFGMRLDNSTELALADQLSRLGMKEMATAVLQRTRQRGGQSVNDLLEIANRYLANGENEAAAEVAYGALRKLSSGDDLNGSYYRQRVVQLLKTANRLDSLLATAEQRVASAPKSIALKMELAELYTAAGRTSDADKLFEQVAAENPNDSKSLWKTAERLSAAGKHGEAVDKYLMAIAKDAAPLRQDFYKFQNAVNSARAADKVYLALMDADLTKFDSYILGNLIGLYQNESREPSDITKQFIDKLLTKAPTDSLGSIFRTMYYQKELLKTESMKSTVVRIFSTTAIYQPDASFWQETSRSSGGSIGGPIDPCLDTVNGDHAYRTQVRALIAAHAEGKDASPIAKALLVAIEVDENGDVGKLSEQINSLLNDKDHLINQQFWWQIGQRFERKKGFENLAVEILEHARDQVTNQNSGSGYEYSIDAKLADAYVTAGQQQKARAELLRGYASIDTEQQNISNPGYGDYQAIQTAQSVATKLQKVGADFDAIRIYTEMLAKPERFEAAKRWGGNQDYKTRIEQAFAKACESLTEADFSQFLTLTNPVSEPKQPTDAKAKLVKPDPSFDLIPISALTGSKFAHPSIATMVVAKLIQSDAGKAQLTEFDKQAASRLQTTADDVALLAMRALIAVSLPSDDASEQLVVLKQRVATMPLESDSGPQRTNKLLNCFQPATVALGSENVEIKAAAIDLAKALVERAKPLECHDAARTISLALLKSGGADNDPAQVALTMQAMLDAVVPATDEVKVQTSPVASECLKVAELAAQAGAWQVSMESLRRGFGGGSPLRAVATTNSSAGAFIAQALPRTSSRSTNTDESADLAALTTRLLAIFAPLEPTAKQPMSPADTKLAYETLIKIVLPESRGDEVFPYLTELVVDSNRVASQVVDLNPTSLSKSLALAAIRCEKVDDYLALLTKRQPTSQSPELIELLRLQLVVLKKDWTAAETTLRELSNRFVIAPASKLAAAQAAKKNVSDPRTTANLLLHVVLPIHDYKPLESLVMELETHLLEVAAHEQTVASAGDKWSWLAKQWVGHSKVDDTTAQRVIDRYLDSVRLRYSNYSGSYGLDQSSAASVELADVAITASRFEIAARLLHNFALRPSEGNTTASRVSRFALKLVVLDAGVQYELLKTIAFGDNDILGSASDWVMFVKPPEALLSATPNYIPATKISVGASDFPVTSSMLMLCDVAAKVGKTDELLARLRRHVKTPGDEVEAMIGTALLADGRVEETQEILARVVEVLAKTTPTTNVSSPLPIDAAILVAQASSHPSLQQHATAGWKHLMAHSRRRDQGLTACFINRMATQLGIALAGGGKPGSPLKHFVSVSLPYYTKPMFASVDALYVVRDGTVRYAAGGEQAALILKYPLAGEFCFSHRNVRHGWDECHSLFGGTSYQWHGYKNAATVAGLTSRQMYDLPSNPGDKIAAERFAIDVRKDAVAMMVNDKELATDERTSTMPFAGLYFSGGPISEFSDIKIVGTVTIPREVGLIDEQLRGWSCPILGGSLPILRLPRVASADTNNFLSQREGPLGNLKAQTNWYVAGDELLSGDMPGAYNVGDQRHLQYLRPLLDGESLTYDFHYEQDKQEVHPSIGRVVVLLRPDGVKLRWLLQSQSLEATDMEPLHEVAPDELIGDGKPELKANDWNTVKLTAEQSHVVVEVNGKPVCRFAKSLDQRFGFLGEKERSCRIRNAKLTGPWPTELPTDLMEE